MEKLTVPQPVKFLPILWNSKVHYYVHKSLPFVPIFSQIDLVYALPTYFFKIHIHINLPCMVMSFKWPLSLRFPTKTLYTFLFSPIHAPKYKSDVT